MNKITNIGELHAILLAIAKVFHQICVKEDIPYFMVAGTLLGAVRHKGFIPWDDDMDFGVPRPYYEKLKKVLKKELSYPYKLYTNEEGIVWTNYYKIADERTMHSHSWDSNKYKEFGVNIDIFPIDFVKSPWKRRFIDVLCKLVGYKIYSAKDRPLPKKIVAYMVKGMMCFITKERVARFIDAYLVEKEGEMMTNIYGAYGAREIMPKEYFGAPVLMDFEETKLYGVAKPHEYLQTMYGDYMKLPPEEKRRVHIIDMYWK